MAPPALLMSNAKQTHPATSDQARADSAAVTEVPHRVLLVEDHAGLAEATAELLRFHGLEVRVATSGQDALGSVLSFSPALVLCDLMLPDMSGFAVAQALRATRPATELLIAVCTAMGPRDVRAAERQAATSGVDVVLSKPLTDATLSSLISRLQSLSTR
jgi:two-component system OmpR family response regulator